MSKITVEETFQIITCATCAVRFGLHVGHISKRRKDNKTFYCPNQHANVYTKKTNTEIEKLKKKVEEQEATIQKLIKEKSELQATNGNLEQIVDVFHRKVDVLQQRLQDVSTADCQ